MPERFPSLAKLLSQSLIRPGSLIQQRSTSKYRLCYVRHGSSPSHCHHLKRYYSQAAAVLVKSEEDPVADGGSNGLAPVAPRGFQARMIKAREAERLRISQEKSAAFKKAIKQSKGDEWLYWVRKSARGRRISHEATDDQMGLDWADVFDANLLQLTTLIAAQRAAVAAERAMEEADPVDPASVDEARRLRDNATRLEELAAQQMKAYEELRAMVRAKVEAHPVFLDDSRTGRLRAQFDARCPICFMPHPATSCPHLFDDPKAWLPGISPDGFPDATVLFKKRWEVDANFREAIRYLRSKFSRAPGSYEVLPLRRQQTLDAPPSAIPFLREFNRRAWFKTILHYDLPKNVAHADELSLLQGFYRTTDDDGFPLIILYPIVAPSDISSDPRFEHEVRLMRSFAACWRKGQLSKYGVKPFSDAQQIGIIICDGRWHTSHSMWMGQNALRVTIASEETWKKGEVYRSLHISTDTNELTGEYRYWTGGSVIQNKWLDHSQWGSSSILDSRFRYKRNLVAATLRDVRDTATPILLREIKEGNPEATQGLLRWRREVELRAIDKYGAGSAQAFLCSREAYVSENRGLV
ncbi:hypothetical protein VMCG_10188 [Cytospora schulzeri]|uniref:Uncharacterized protein n=1 Tax=Cytospora schulzeri TaxID=448051 RepID=A0A423VCY3_9PEZI|nr:hypothetical protein VMCG_10188 [Valsa malicola]